MSTNPRDLQFGFSGFGQVRGVFSSLAYTYPGTLRIEGQFTVARRILNDSGSTEDLGVIATVPFAFGPGDFGVGGAPVATFPGRHPGTDALTNRTWSLPDVMEALYSLKRSRWAQYLDDRFPVEPQPE